MSDQSESLQNVADAISNLGNEIDTLKAQNSALDMAVQAQARELRILRSTRRIEFAKSALQGLSVFMTVQAPEAVARHAFSIADAMIAEITKDSVPQNE